MTAQHIADFEMSRVILGNMLHNEAYALKVIPYLNDESFVDATEKAIASSIVDYNGKYHKVPNAQELVVEMKELPWIHKLDKNVVNEVWNQPVHTTDQTWLEKNTEKYIRRRRVSVAFEKTYSRFEDGQTVDDFAQIFQEAISFSFDDSIGMSFVKDAFERWAMYTADDDRIPFALNLMNRVTNGGMPAGTLNCILAGTGVGKSLFMCSEAATAAKNGHKVLYISLEMKELRIAERIEANLMDVPLSKMKEMSEEEFSTRQSKYIKDMEAKGGDIIFKQFPTGTAGAGDFRNLIIECKNKIGYDFSQVYIDYLGICKPMSGQAGDNSYTKIKNIAEELRALAIMFDVPIITAAQTNKGGQGSSSLSLQDVAESHGLSQTVDMLFAMISTPEFEDQGKLMFQQLKNRYGALNWYNRFVVGLDRSKMRLFDIDESASDEHNQHTQPATTEEAIESLDLTALGIRPVHEGLSNLNNNNSSEESKPSDDPFQDFNKEK